MGKPGRCLKRLVEHVPGGTRMRRLWRRGGSSAARLGINVRHLRPRRISGRERWGCDTGEWPELLGREGAGRGLPRDAGPLGEPVNAAGRSPPGSVPGSGSALRANRKTRGSLCITRRIESDRNPGRTARPLRPSRTPRSPPGHRATPPEGDGGAPARGPPTWPFADARPLAVETAGQVAQTGALTASVFDAYRPSVRVPGACPHPTRLVESAAMAAATAPPSDYRPTLPEYLVTQGVLSDAQLETVSRAGAAHAEHLPGNGEEARPRQGFFVGDGTGVG